MSKEEIYERLSVLLGRGIWKEGTPFTSEIRLTERKVSRSKLRFVSDLEAAFKGVAGEVKEMDLPSDCLLDIILHDEVDNNENKYRDWLFVRVRLVRQ